MRAPMTSNEVDETTTAHAKMTKDEWEAIYLKAWDIYYSPEHVETLMRRTAATSANPVKQTGRIAYHVGQFYGIVQKAGIG